MPKTQMPEAVREWFVPVGSKSTEVRRQKILEYVRKANPELDGPTQEAMAELLWKTRMQELARRGGEATRLLHERRRAAEAAAAQATDAESES